MEDEKTFSFLEPVLTLSCLLFSIPHVSRSNINKTTRDNFVACGQSPGLCAGECGSYKNLPSTACDSKRALVPTTTTTTTLSGTSQPHLYSVEEVVQPVVEGSRVVSLYADNRLAPNLFLLLEEKKKRRRKEYEKQEKSNKKQTETGTKNGEQQCKKINEDERKMKKKAYSNNGADRNRHKERGAAAQNN